MALYVVTGPPAAGKSTWCRQQAQPGDIVIDYDSLASSLAAAEETGHDHTPVVKAVTKAARQAAIDTAIRHAAAVDVYVIHSTPSAKLLGRYRAQGAKVIVIDPGRDVVLARAKAERPWWMRQVIEAWYAQAAQPAAALPPPVQVTPTTQATQQPTGNALSWGTPSR